MANEDNIYNTIGHSNDSGDSKLSAQVGKLLLKEPPPTKKSSKDTKVQEITLTDIKKSLDSQFTKEDNFFKYLQNYHRQHLGKLDSINTILTKLNASTSKSLNLFTNSGMFPSRYKNPTGAPNPTELAFFEKFAKSLSGTAGNTLSTLGQTAMPFLPKGAYDKLGSQFSKGLEQALTSPKTASVLKGLLTPATIAVGGGITAATIAASFIKMQNLGYKGQDKDNSLLTEVVKGIKRLLHIPDDSNKIDPINNGGYTEVVGSKNLWDDEFGRVHSLGGNNSVGNSLGSQTTDREGFSIYGIPNSKGNPITGTPNSSRSDYTDGDTSISGKPTNSIYHPKVQYTDINKLSKQSGQQLLIKGKSAGKYNRKELIKLVSKDPRFEYLGRNNSPWFNPRQFQHDIPYAVKGTVAKLDALWKSGARFEVTGAMGSASSPHIGKNEGIGHYNGTKLDIKPIGGQSWSDLQSILNNSSSIKFAKRETSHFDVKLNTGGNQHNTSKVAPKNNLLSLIQVDSSGKMVETPISNSSLDNTLNREAIESPTGEVNEEHLQNLYASNYAPKSNNTQINSMPITPTAPLANAQPSSNIMPSALNTVNPMVMNSNSIQPSNMFNGSIDSIFRGLLDSSLRINF